RFATSLMSSSIIGLTSSRLELAQCGSSSQPPPRETVMKDTPSPPGEQSRLWDGPSGQGWVELQGVVGRPLAPVQGPLGGAVAAQRARHVLDVGCGTGATTLAIARQLGPRGRCVGLDISQPMIAVARSRAARAGSRAEFVCADAQSHAFEPAVFDSLVSRFG